MCHVRGERQNRKRVIITLKKSGRKAYWPPQAARLEASFLEEKKGTPLKVTVTHIQRITAPVFGKNSGIQYYTGFRKAIACSLSQSAVHAEIAAECIILPGIRTCI